MSNNNRIGCRISLLLFIVFIVTVIATETIIERTWPIPEYQDSVSRLYPKGTDPNRIDLIPNFWAAFANDMLHATSPYLFRGGVIAIIFLLTVYIPVKLLEYGANSHKKRRP